ncbi:DUF6880 family protein [Rubellimicrobium roseum]|uniref:DUF6880 family protein n=1 Tax=Rubellimicrobium roseum TaxID=687525 RepID=UPI003CCC5438
MACSTTDRAANWNAARHHLDFASLASAAPDYGVIEPHDAYMVRLKAEHGRKREAEIAICSPSGRDPFQPVTRPAFAMPWNLRRALQVILQCGKTQASRPGCRLPIMEIWHER